MAVANTLPTMSRARTILIADDDAALRELLRTALEAAGYRVVEAADGVEALKLAAHERPDLLILDISMPRLDGWAVLRQLESQPATAGLPVIVLTAVATDERDILRGLEEGAVQYLTKPFYPDDVVAEVRIILDVFTGPMRDQYRRELIDKRRRWMAGEERPAGEVGPAGIELYPAGQSGSAGA
jgi:DNA-binding response OmpR family regulator